MDFLFSLSFKRNPIAVWFLKEELYHFEKNNNSNPAPKPKYVTLGWKQFEEKLQENNISLDIISDSRWQKPEKQNEKHIYDNIKSDLEIGKYIIRDGLYLLLGKFQNNTNKTIKMNGVNCTLNARCNFLSEKAIENVELFFNAPPKYKKNIRRGKQPLRTAQHYRNMEKENNHTGDETEGISAITNYKNTTNVKNVIVEESAYDAYIFSMHNNPNGISKFGKDLYKIQNRSEWIEKVFLEVEKFWFKKSQDYVGCFIYLGEVTYNDDKDPIKSDLTGEDALCKTGFVGKGVKMQIEGLNIIKKKNTDNFLKDLKRLYFTKRNKYKEEQEVRLIIVPMYSTIDNDGSILNNYHYSNEDLTISMKRLKYLAKLQND